MRHGKPLKDHEIQSDFKLGVEHGPFSGAGNTLGFLYRGWVLLVERRYVRQYGDYPGQESPSHAVGPEPAAEGCIA